MSGRTAVNEAWLAGLPGVQRARPLARLTSFNIGGPADYLAPTDRPEEVVEECARRGVPYLLLGAGTNLLVADAGVEGLVIRCVNREWRVGGRRGGAHAGRQKMRLAPLCAAHQPTRVEWGVGVPGPARGGAWPNAPRSGGAPC